MKELNEKYSEWLWAQFHKGKYGVVFDKLSHLKKLDAFKHAASLLIEERPPEGDKEFMERVGDRVVMLSKRKLDF